MIRRRRRLLLRRLLWWRGNWGSNFRSIFDCIVKVRSRSLKDISSRMIYRCGSSSMMMMMIMWSLSPMRRSRHGYRKMRDDWDVSVQFSVEQSLFSIVW